MLELSNNNEIYRNRVGDLIWRSERNNIEFDYLFAFCNYNLSVAIIASLLVSFECSMTAKSNYDIDLIANN
jgi:hypothetical protein